VSKVHEIMMKFSALTGRKNDPKRAAPALGVVGNIALARAKLDEVSQTR
jgi:hypothetical protein